MKGNHRKKILYSEIIGSRKNYNPIWIEEYKMMREEIVNYMDKQQALRDMLYVAMAACIVFAFSDDVPFLAMLLPLLFILPAYACASITGSASGRHLHTLSYFMSAMWIVRSTGSLGMACVRSIIREWKRRPYERARFSIFTYS